MLQAGDRFRSAIPYNPGYQGVLRDLKQSTRQGFLALRFGYPMPKLEARIVRHETGIAGDMAEAPVSNSPA